MENGSLKFFGSRPFRCTCCQATGDVEVISAIAFSFPLASCLSSSRDRIAELWNTIALPTSLAH